jgi:hypothetical protein
MYDIYLCCFFIKPKRNIRMWSAYADGIVHRGLYAYTHGPYEFMIRIWSGPYAYGLNIRQSLSLVQCEYDKTVRVLWSVCSFLYFRMWNICRKDGMCIFLMYLSPTSVPSFRYSLINALTFGTGRASPTGG